MKIVSGIALLVVLIAGAWLQISGPCWLWSYSPAKNVPGRCVMEGK